MARWFYKTLILVLLLIQKRNYQAGLTKTQNIGHKMVVSKFFKDCIKKRVKIQYPFQNYAKKGNRKYCMLITLKIAEITQKVSMGVAIENALQTQENKR